MKYELLVASVMSNSVTTWTVALQSPLSMARILERVAIPSPGDLPNPEIKPRSPTLQADSLPSEPPGKPEHLSYSINIRYSVDPKQLSNKRWTEKPNRSWLTKLVYLGTSSGYLNFTNIMFHVSSLWTCHPFCFA